MREGLMGQAKRKASRRAEHKPRAQLVWPDSTRNFLDDSSVDRILDQSSFGQAGGDPAAGIATGVLAGAAIWTLLAFVLL
jgi:hypothetical protein